MKNTTITLADLRSRTGQVKQAVIAATMQIQEPAVSKLERKEIGHTSLNKMAKYISALGGKLDVTITLADGSAITLEDLCA